MARRRLDREKKEGKLAVSRRLLWPTRFLTCAGASARPMWTIHGPGAPDGNYVRAGRKLILRGAAGCDFRSQRP
jgi:hypothetical protein